MDYESNKKECRVERNKWKRIEEKRGIESKREKIRAKWGKGRGGLK